MTSISEILGPEKVEELYTTQFEHLENKEPIKSERDKYKPYKEMLETNRGLRETIEKVFEQSQTIPAVHITSEFFITQNDKVNSGFIENILKNGFRSKDTNIGIFMKREGTRQPAVPVDYVNQPEKFLRELETLIRHYYHHGVRTNKDLLGDSRDMGIGIPVMLLVDVANANLESGSDYEDHYKLSTSIPGNKLIGKIQLENVGSEIRERLPEIAIKFLKLTENYIEKSSQHLPK